LAEKAKHWKKTGRDASALLVGPSLVHFMTWAAYTDLVLTETEQTYLHASRAAEAAHQASETQREKRRWRRLRVLNGVLLGVSTLAMGLAAYTFKRWHKAMKQQSIFDF
jgi:hypothetical protein